MRFNKWTLGLAASGIINLGRATRFVRQAEPSIELVCKGNKPPDASLCEIAQLYSEKDLVRQIQAEEKWLKRVSNDPRPKVPRKILPTRARR